MSPIPHKTKNCSHLAAKIGPLGVELPFDLVLVPLTPEAGEGHFTVRARTYLVSLGAGTAAEALRRVRVVDALYAPEARVRVAPARLV